MLHVTVVQPRYFSGKNPDETIANFLLGELQKVPKGGLILVPEYSNAGGLSDAQSEMNALPHAERMLKQASLIAKKKEAYVAINIL